MLKYYTLIKKIGETKLFKILRCMRYLKLLIILTVPLLWVNCTKNHEELLNQEQERFIRNFKTTNIPRYSSNELIIKFNVNVSNKVKQQLRDNYGVINYETCDLCDDSLIEKWIFGNGINVEDTKLSIQSGSGGPEGDITNVDYEFVFKLESESDPLVSGSSGTGYIEQIVPSNSGVTIAVLDTGIDANYPLFPAPFLYNAIGLSGGGELSGWDFVGHDPNCYDEYSLIHGTKVSYIINKKLTEEGVPHQILPVRVCDSNGVATYFNILCGMQYALPKADIIQMSLGWYESNTNVNTIFSALLMEYEQDVLVVTSAGNNTKNTDAEVHYPSSYPQRNVLSIAAANTEYSNSAWFSNFGKITVDFYAPGENIPFYDIYMTEISISGTSYAAPWVTALSARELYNSGMNYTPAQIINQLNSIALPVAYSRPVKFNKLLN